MAASPSSSQETGQNFILRSFQSAQICNYQHSLSGGGEQDWERSGRGWWRSITSPCPPRHPGGHCWWAGPGPCFGPESGRARWARARTARRRPSTASPRLARSARKVLRRNKVSVEYLLIRYQAQNTNNIKLTQQERAGLAGRRAGMEIDFF